MVHCNCDTDKWAVRLLAQLKSYPAYLIEKVYRVEDIVHSTRPYMFVNLKAII